MNRELKLAVVGSGFKTYEIERRAKIPHTKLSRIIHQGALPTDDEMERIAEVLNEPVDQLFHTRGHVIA